MIEEPVSETKTADPLGEHSEKIVQWGLFLFSALTVYFDIYLCPRVSGALLAYVIISLIARILIIVFFCLSFLDVSRGFLRFIGGTNILLSFLTAVFDLLCFSHVIGPALAFIDFAEMFILAIANLYVARKEDSYLSVKRKDAKPKTADVWAFSSLIGIIVYFALEIYLHLLYVSVLAKSNPGDVLTFHAIIGSLAIVFAIMVLVFLCSAKTRSKAKTRKTLGVVVAIYLSIRFVSMFYSFMKYYIPSSVSSEAYLFDIFKELANWTVLLTFYLVYRYAMKSSSLPGKGTGSSKQAASQEAKPAVSVSVPVIEKANGPAITKANEALVWTGTPKEVFLFLLKNGLLNLITLGFYSAWFVCKFKSFIFERSVYDGKRYAFGGTGKELFPLLLKWFLLCLVTLGIYSFWAFGHFMEWQNSNTKEATL